jgi:hypothetical protein
MARPDELLERALDDAVERAASAALKELEAAGFHCSGRAREKLWEIMRDWALGRVILG